MCIVNLQSHVLGKEVTGGKLNATMKWQIASGGTVTLLKITLDLCDLITDIGYHCPVSPGNYLVHYHNIVIDAMPEV